MAKDAVSIVFYIHSMLLTTSFHIEESRDQTVNLTWICPSCWTWCTGFALAQFGAWKHRNKMTGIDEIELNQ